MKIDSMHYCWVIGNTGFRESALYEKIELYLLILEEFTNEKYVWSKNQREFFELMKKHGLMENGSNSQRNSTKAARLKTSPLEKLGLISQDRKITEVGKGILNRAKLRINNNKISFDQQYFLENDGDIYITQLLKLQFFANDNKGIRPFVLFLDYLKEFKHLTYDEISYILPLIICEELKEYGKNLIYDYRNKKQCKNFDKSNWIKKHIINHKYKIIGINNIRNYIEVNINDLRIALEENNKEFIENFIIKIDDNGKSKDYSLKLYDLFIYLYGLWANIDNFSIGKRYLELIISAINKVTQTQQKEWRKLILGVTNKSTLKNINDDKARRFIDYFKENFYNKNFQIFILNFFDSLWYIKFLNNLNDYADHNIRYLKLSNILENVYINGEKAIKINEFYNVLVDKILRDKNIRKMYFNRKEYKNYLYKNTYKLPLLLEEDMNSIAINTIRQIENISKEKIHRKKPDGLNYRQWIDGLKNKYVQKRIINMIEESRQAITRKEENNIINHLTYIEKRLDNKLKDILDTEADTPTIFEYLVWQSFLLFGDYKENPIKFANFSLDNDLKPIQHAGGGMADVIFKYDCHDLMLEATLTNNENQRKLEMEPVPRHLARYRHEINNNSYCIFIAPNIDPNVAVVHRAFKKYPYYVKDKNNNEYKAIKELMILPMSICELKHIIIYSLKNDILYKDLKEVFSKLLNSETLDGYMWYSNEVKPMINSLMRTKRKYVDRKQEAKLIAEDEEDYLI